MFKKFSKKFISGLLNGFQWNLIIPFLNILCFRSKVIWRRKKDSSSHLRWKLKPTKPATWNALLPIWTVPTKQSLGFSFRVTTDILFYLFVTENTSFSILDIDNGFDIFGFDDTAVVNENKTAAVIALGDPISMTCGASDHNYTDLAWYYNGEVLSIDDRMYF